MSILQPNNTGFSLSPTAPSNSALSIAAVGTAYALTTSQALLDFGTTDPILTITEPGTYLLLANVRVDYTAATFAAVRNVTLKLRRTNNTAADITGATTTFQTQIITTLTFTAFDGDLPPVIYTTLNNNDIIHFFGGIDTGPTAGTIDAVAASIVAIKLS